MKGQFALFRSPRFWPLFVTQFFGAFNDNVIKNALLLLITFKLGMGSEGEIAKLTSVAGGLLILPFFLFSATAGSMADRFDKARLARWLKLFELLIMIPSAIGFLTGNVNLLMFVIFLLGTQAAFFGPLKYSILPELVERHALLGANALVGAGTFIAILAGTILGGQLVMLNGGEVLVSVAGGLASLIGAWAAFRLPPVPSAAPETPIPWNIVSATWRIVRHTTEHPRIFRCIIGISWFWFVGAVFLTQIPAYTRSVIGGNESVVTLFLCTFVIGIAVGALLCNRILRGRPSGNLAPLGAIGITAFIFTLYASTHGIVQTTDSELMGFRAFLATPHGWQVCLSLFLIAVSGGIYAVPLYTLMQHLSEPEHRSRNIAANNIINALLMVISTVFTVVLVNLGLTLPEIFLAMGMLSVLVAAYVCLLLPDALLMLFGRLLFKVLYRVEVRGMEHYEAAGERTVIIANHTSFLDAPILATFLPEKPTFAINTYIAQKAIFKPFLAMCSTFPIDPGNPLSIKEMVEHVKQNKRLVIFPEGRITTTGGLMKVYDGPAMIAEKSDAKILPVYIDGAQYTPLSRLKGKYPVRWFPKITITILPPHTPPEVTGLSGKAKRKLLGSDLYNLLCLSAFRARHTDQNLFQAVQSAACRNGYSRDVLIDAERKPMNYRQLLLRSYILGRALTKGTNPDERLGILLPNSLAVVVSFFGLQAYGRVPAMLNFSVGINNMLACCTAAQVKRIVTSRRFVALAKLEDEIEKLSERANVVYLEDLRASIGLGAKLAGFMKLLTRAAPSVSADEPAVVLFTSGSEGTPKGVVLSHRNITSNVFQAAARVDFGPYDKVLNVLPVFHCFGLTAGTLLPLLFGIRTFLYPSPLHYRIIPEVAYDFGATIFFATDTFFSKYAKTAHPFDFHTVRYAVAGAEKLKAETRQLWMETFGIRIYEGYGVTETSPVVSVNTALENRPGSVGKLLPDMEAKLEPVPGITDGGRLYLKGPNVMIGYLFHHAPGVLQPTHSEAGAGWHDTGDIVEIDGEGYLFIRGRAKRFAKIGGEMVSLQFVEDQVKKLWPAFSHAVVSRPDPRKGEELVLITDNPEADTATVHKAFKAQGIAELNLPKKVMIVSALPVLGTGKTDYVTLNKLATEASITASE